MEINNTLPTSTAALEFDLPFGHDLFLHDVQVIPEFLTNAITQFDATQTQSNYVVIMGHKPTDAHTVADMFESRGIKNATSMYWVKPEQYQKGPQKRMTLAVEQVIVGYVPNADGVFWCPSHNSADPRESENLINIPSLTTLAKDTAGNIINVTEKPPLLSSWYFEKWCPRGTWVMVVGAGAGGSVKGALLAGLNVVAVECDPVQFHALRSELVAWMEDMGEKKKQEKTKSISATADAKMTSPLKLTQSGATAAPASSSVENKDKECFACDDPPTNEKGDLFKCNCCVKVFHLGCMVCWPVEDEKYSSTPSICNFCFDKAFPDIGSP